MNYIHLNDDCPFTQLPLEIAFKILTQLESDDYKNLYFTCRKWHKTILSLPESMKLIIEPKGAVIMRNNGFLKMCGEGLLFTPRYNFGATKILKINHLYLNPFESDAQGEFTFTDLLTFLVDNRNRIVIRTLYMRMSFYEEDHDLVNQIVDMATRLELQSSYNERKEKDFQPLDETTFFSKHLNFCSLKTYRHVSLSTVNLILKQWIQGEREELEWIDIRFDETKETGRKADIHAIVETITKGVEHFVEDTNFDVAIGFINGVQYEYDDCQFNINVSDNRIANIKVNGQLFRFELEDLH